MDIVLKYLVRVGDKLHCVCALYHCGWSSCPVAIGVWVEQCGGSWSEKAGEVQGRFFTNRSHPAWSVELQEQRCSLIRPVARRSSQMSFKLQ